MPRDILSEYGPESPSHKVATGSSGLTTDGGKPYCHTEKYSPPQGPQHMMNERPGLPGGVNTGNNPMHTYGEASGSPGVGGANHGNKGSQGVH